VYDGSSRPDRERGSRDYPVIGPHRIGARRRSFSRVLYDIAHILESADAPDDRLRRVLELLWHAIPYDECALLELRPALSTRILVVPEPSLDEEIVLVAKLDELLARLIAERGGTRPISAEGKLAVPLVGSGEIIGILFVRLAAGGYSERHLRTLAIVGGQLGAYLSIVRTHDELEARTRELDEARRAALVVSRAKDEFLAVMSHELKDPVASTLAWAHMLGAESGDPGGPARAAAAIERNSHSLAKLIDDIQGLACVASAELRLDLRAIEPSRLLKAAIDGLRTPGRSTKLDSAADPSPGWLPVVPELLGPAVSSVVASTTRVTPRGGYVAVRLDRAGDVVGIDSDDGRAGLEPQGVRATGERETARALDGIRVLIVDDDPDIREAFQWVLEHYGAAVTAVGSAVAALAALERSRPDVLLCDIAMPGENGYDLMRQVATRDAALPAAALTAFGEIADRGRARAAGFRMQLSKPIDAAVLVAAVADLAGRRSAMGAPLNHAGRL
jgi:CheY-like chemotaxis protein